jgi:hypothetical protein
VRAILTEAQWGRFSLKSDQTAPLNAFVDLQTLQETLEMEGRANLILSGMPVSLADAWRIEDAGLREQALDGVSQLQSARIPREDSSCRSRKAAAGIRCCSSAMRNASSPTTSGP